ncbi:MAG TPA: hypothetical protein PK246_10100 [Saprospiraceae bacterium]|nr:hypothetical protein [Saprospiraceae bacterium]
MKLTLNTLRPRFEFVTNESPKMLNERMGLLASQTEDLVTSGNDYHIVLGFKNNYQHFWSPQANLNVEDINADTFKVNGLIGPKPNTWVLLMFGYGAMGVGLLFSLIIYLSNRSLNIDSNLIYLCVALGIGLLALYMVTVFGRRIAYNDSARLYNFIKEHISEIEDDDTSL